MAKCNRKQRLLGKSIRRIRMRRNMTQRELANAAGLGESAFRSYDELMHALFLSEEAFSIKPCADGSIRFTDETIQSCVCTWWSWKEFLKEGKITREEYENRKDSFLR